jgi:NAD-dependent DNA ligase
MIQVDRVKPSTLKKILKDFTLEELAQAKPEDLTDYEGVGGVIAWRIIVAARKEVKVEVARKAVEPDMQFVMPPPGVHVGPMPRFLNLSPPVNNPPATESIRVQRIREGLAT